MSASVGAPLGNGGAIVASNLVADAKTIALICSAKTKARISELLLLLNNFQKRQDRTVVEPDITPTQFTFPFAQLNTRGLTERARAEIPREF